MPRFTAQGDVQTTPFDRPEETVLATETLLVGLQESLPIPNPFLRPLRGELLKIKQAPLSLSLQTELPVMPSGESRPEGPPRLRFRVISQESVPNGDAILFSPPTGFQKVARPTFTMPLPNRAGRANL
jgi:hypothetical protein